MVGGKGTRLRPLTETTYGVAGSDRPCLMYPSSRRRRRKTSSGHGYKSEVVAEIGDGKELGISISYPKEDELVAGAIKQIDDRLDDIFVAANGTSLQT